MSDAYLCWTRLPFYTFEYIYFIPSVVSNHNQLGGLQGGTSDEYYHLSNSEHTIATQQATSSQDGYLTSSDWNTFNDKQDVISFGTLSNGDGIDSFS